MRETQTDRSYDPLERLRAGDFRARTAPDKGGCSTCDGYGHDRATEVVCTDCAGTGRYL